MTEILLWSAIILLFLECAYLFYTILQARRAFKKARECWLEADQHLTILKAEHARWSSLYNELLSLHREMVEELPPIRYQ